MYTLVCVFVYVFTIRIIYMDYNIIALICMQYRIFLLFVLKNFCVFHFHNHKRFLVKFSTWILWRLAKAGNCERLLGNENKDVKQHKFFNMNDKQYMVVYIRKYYMHIIRLSITLMSIMIQLLTQRLQVQLQTLLSLHQQA